MGSTTYDVSFTVRSDTIIETDETFGLEIMVTDESSSLDVLLSGNNVAIVTLQDDDNFGKLVLCSLIWTCHLCTPYLHVLYCFL